jgi:hypothetical protein
MKLNVFLGLWFIVVGFLMTLFGEPFIGWGFLFIGMILEMNAYAIMEARYD